MRTLTIQAGRFAPGTLYEIYQTSGTVRLKFGERPGVTPVCGVRVDRAERAGTLAEKVGAWPLFDAHCAELGVEPFALVPCAACTVEVAACLTVCPACAEDTARTAPVTRRWRFLEINSSIPAARFCTIQFEGSRAAYTSRWRSFEADALAELAGVEEDGIGNRKGPWREGAVPAWVLEAF